MGMLRAQKDADLQDPASWTQVSAPVLTTNDTYTGKYGTDPSGVGTGIAGPGHNSFVVDESGNLALAFHARPYVKENSGSDQHTGNDAGGLFDPDRNTWIKSVNVRANGMLDLSLTKDQEVAPANRTVTAKVVVAAASTTPDVPGGDPGTGDKPSKPDSGTTDSGTTDSGAGSETKPELTNTGSSVAIVAGVALLALVLGGAVLAYKRRRD
jgi:LPXTG-motif cell wall-anchored protein